MYGGGGQDETAAMLAAWGMTAEQAAHFAASADEAVWPENWQAVDVFCAVSTQWRHGYAGPTGLDYAVLPAVLDLAGVVMDERADVFHAIRVMESEALERMHDHGR